MSAFVPVLTLLYFCYFTCGKSVKQTRTAALLFHMAVHDLYFKDTREFFPRAVKLEPPNVGARRTSLSVQGSGMTRVFCILSSCRETWNIPNAMKNREDF